MNERLIAHLTAAVIGISGAALMACLVITLTKLDEAQQKIKILEKKLEDNKKCQ